MIARNPCRILRTAIALIGQIWMLNRGFPYRSLVKNYLQRVAFKNALCILDSASYHPEGQGLHYFLIDFSLDSHAILRNLITIWWPYGQAGLLFTICLVTGVRVRRGFREDSKE